MFLGKIFNPKAIKLDLESDFKDEVFEELIELLVSSEPSLNRNEILFALQERERLMSTGIKKGVALPHCKIKGIQGVRGAIGVSQKGIEYNALDLNPVHLVFMIVASSEDSLGYLQVLKQLALILNERAFLQGILEQNTAVDVHELIKSYEKKMAEKKII
ncbi:MAG TPA: PTS sugar transporter subunit IIA [Treponemataceae bacterium]|jgi:mannitol/fructose-specific phosphotransferase system IIA component (Ntr-type)|nr:PTS sugar transporter subunit IIA [Treponemataceae bacterium]